MADAPDLRIDATGTVHPLVRGASQELRMRAGDWRLLASPAEVVLALRPGGRSLRLAGEVRTPGALCDVVATIAHGGLGGELAVHGEEGVRSLYFDRGNVVGATSGVAGERLGEILWRFGAITRDQLDEILSSAQLTGKRVGEAAIDLEFVGPEDLFMMMGRQVEELFYSAVQIARGTFFLFDGLGDTQIPRPHHLSTSQLLMEAARRMDEMGFFREKIPSSEWVPTPLPSGVGRRPPPELQDVFAQCDGRRSVAEIGRRIGQLEFDVTRAVFQLVTAGSVVVTQPRPDGPAAVVDVFNRALSAIHGACDAAGRGKELRTGVEQFALSTGVYVPLFAGAGPLPDGTLRAEKVARNVGTLAGGSADQVDETWLVQQLFEYAGFALFQAGTFLPRDAEVKLAGRVAEMLKPLRQQNDGGKPPSLRPSLPPASSRRGQVESR
jgi:Domain of unknown function (DUF4388)